MNIIRKFCRLNEVRATFSERHWFRRLHGGKWEQWWADPVTAYVWLSREEWTPPGNRPGGCAIWHSDPRPKAREEWE